MSRQQVRTSQGKNHSIDRTLLRGGDRNEAYVEGNTVRKRNAVPQRITREREEREQEVRRRVDHQTRVNRERAMRMNPAYLIFLTLAVGVVVGVCGLYIKLQSELSGFRKHVAVLESQIFDLRAENDAALNRIETSVDLDEVRDTAQNSLGMVYPSQEQIIYFTVDTNDYMNQYQDIPEK